MAETERFELLSSTTMECAGCKQLRQQVDDLKRVLMGTDRTTDEVRFATTFISERQQVEIDKMLLESRRKADRYEEMFNKVSDERQRLARDIEEMSRQLAEKQNEVAALIEQNEVYASDFRLEREDRERTHGKLVDLEQQLAAASSRIAELEDDKKQLMMTVMAVQREVPTSMRQRSGVSAAVRSVPSSPSSSRPSVLPYSSAHHQPTATYNVYLQPSISHGAARPHHGYFYGAGRDVCDVNITERHQAADDADATCTKMADVQLKA